MSPETWAKIKARAAEHRRRIASGEVLVCNAARPMPSDRDQMGQTWFHEDARADDSKAPYPKAYLCPNCKHRFMVSVSPL